MEVHTDFDTVSRLQVYPLYVNSSPRNKMAVILVDGIFKRIFLNEKLQILIKISLKFFFPKGPNWQWYSIGLDNGLASNRRQAIIWTKAPPIHWHMYVALWGDESIHVAYQSCICWISLKKKMAFSRRFFVYKIDLTRLLNSLENYLAGPKVKGL